MSQPLPLLDKNKPVDWWFAFKFNGDTYPGDEAKEPNPGMFGGKPKDYEHGFCLNYAVASSGDEKLKLGEGYLGTTQNDPLGATFNQIYNGDCYYVLWNDQFYNEPIENKGAPWGHSKGALAWDEEGNGFVLQVTTPSWPASGSVNHPRQNDGNTLGCVKDDDVMVSQHFFALKLTKDDVEKVLKHLAHASVVTDPTIKQIVNNGGPESIQALVNKLGKESDSITPMYSTLSTGVRLLSKPSQLHVPTWQMVSAELGGVDLRVASWWENPEIYSTDAETPIKCWYSELDSAGAVQIATSGTWEDKVIGLKGGDGTKYNHAKIGVSTSYDEHLTIFGDMNQQGTLDGIKWEKVPCASSQNGRGGLFFVMDDKALHKSVSGLLKGTSAPLAYDE